MRAGTVGIAALVALIGSAGQARAQGALPVAVEVRGGFAVPTGEWAEEEDIENGYLYGANVQLKLAPLFSLYAGWERYSFDLDLPDRPDLAGLKGDATDSGFRAGAQASLPLAGLPGINPFVVAGLTYGSLEAGTTGNGASLYFDSDRAVGFEVGGGVAIPVAPTLSLTPALRYAARSAEFDTFAAFGSTETTVSYFSFDVGLKLGF